MFQVVAAPQAFRLVFTRMDTNPGEDTTMVKATKLSYLVLFVCSVAALPTFCRSKYVGKSGCDPAFKRGPGTYRIRLDQTQRSYLVAHTVGSRNVLLIVRHKDELDRCGLVQDAVVSADTMNAFEFNCVDRREPTAVVVGTRRKDDMHVAGTAHQAWLVDLSTLTFTPDPERVSCKRISYAGADNGEDLATLAKRRVCDAKNCN